jgi:hypothetical protein
MDIFFLLRVHVAHLKIIKLSLNQLGNNKKKKTKYKYKNIIQPRL